MEQKQPFKNLEIPEGRGAPKYPLERKFQGGGGAVVEKPSIGEYGHFLQRHNAVHSILYLNLLLLIMNHTTQPESGYEVASCLVSFCAPICTDCTSFCEHNFENQEHNL